MLRNNNPSLESVRTYGGVEMGTVIHDAMIVTSFDLETLGKAHRVAIDTFDGVSVITPSPVNGYWSFLVASSGSKEGWAECTHHAERMLQTFAEIMASEMALTNERAAKVFWEAFNRTAVEYLA